MAYELRHFDTPLLRFEAIDSTYAAELNITWINEEKRHLLPLDLEPDGDSLFKWLKHRTIPKNRAFVHNFLSKCGLNLNRPLSIIQVSKGLSLNDCYWVVEMKRVQNSKQSQYISSVKGVLPIRWRMNYLQQYQSTSC